MKPNNPFIPLAMSDSDDSSKHSTFMGYKEAGNFDADYVDSGSSDTNSDCSSCCVVNKPNVMKKTKTMTTTTEKEKKDKLTGQQGGKPVAVTSYCVSVHPVNKSLFDQQVAHRKGRLMKKKMKEEKEKISKQSIDDLLGEVKRSTKDIANSSP